MTMMIALLTVGFQVVRARGQFFPSVGDSSIGTLLLVPGWPGNPRDVLGLGAFLAERDINVLMFNPRGMELP